MLPNGIYLKYCKGRGDREGCFLDTFNIIVGLANIVACIVSVISLVKITRISKKLENDSSIRGDKNRNQQITIGKNNKEKINQRMG